MTDNLPRGVTFDKDRNKYRARIHRGGQRIDLGLHDTAKQAERAYLSDVAQYGLPKQGALTPEQDALRRERYAEWLSNRETFEGAMFTAFGDYDPRRPWRIGSTFKFEGRKFELIRFDYECTVWGEHIAVIVLATPCSTKECDKRALTYYWTNRDKPLNRPIPVCPVCNVEGRKHFQQDRATNLAVWDAVHATMGRDRLADGPLPDDRRDEAKARADRLRTYLRDLLETVYDSTDDLPADWYQRYVRGGFDRQGDPLPMWTMSGNEAQEQARPDVSDDETPSRAIVRYGKQERHVIEMIESVYAADDSADYYAFLDACVAVMPAPAEGRRDVRRFEVNRAIQSLAKRRDAVLRIDKGRVIFCS
jgi:hypothetical protein